MKKASVLIILLLLAGFAGALEPGKVIYAMIIWKEGKHEIISVKVAIDYQTEMNPNGNYLVKLINSENKTLYQLKVSKPIDINPAPYNTNIEEKKKWYETKGLSGAFPVTLPYLKEAKTLSFEHGTKILARADLSVLCNKDGKCGERENYLSCPEDCLLDKEDGYCISGEDGICDPDCAEGLDPDCEEKEAEEKIAGFDLIGLAIFAGIAIVILFIFLSKKRKK